jgi:hypothetical protein
MQKEKTTNKGGSQGDMNKSSTTPPIIVRSISNKERGGTSKK